MKKKFLQWKPVRVSAVFFSAFAVVALVACNTAKKEDAEDVAEEHNEAKFEATDLKDDAEFAMKAADGSMMEVALGNLAQTNAASPKVKEFGQMMVKDHSAGGEELKKLAASKNITLPTAMSTDKQEDYDELAAKKGADFDKAYIKFMVKDHKEDIDEFTEAAKECKDPEMKAWAAGKVPTLQHHLSSAESVEKMLK